MTIRLSVVALLLPLAAFAQKIVDAKNVPTTAKPAAADPALAQFGICEKTAPNPPRVPVVATAQTLKRKKDLRIALVGNTLLDRAQEFGYFEAMVQLAHPQPELVICDFAWWADEPDLQPRPENFATVKQHLTREKMDGRHRGVRFQ